MKRKILIIENSTHITGALKSVCRTAYDLRSYYDFVFVLPQGSKGRTWIEGKGFSRIYELPFLEISKRWRSLLFYLPMLYRNSRAVKKIIETEAIDLVHVNDLYNLVFPVAKFMGVKQPYVCHIRFLPDKFPPALFNFWLGLHVKYSKAVVAVSKYLFSNLRPHPKISVIYNELPVEERYPLGLEKRSSPTILYLSNVIRGKGHQFAIESFAQVHHLFPEWRLRFVGGDMGMAKNRAYLQELKQLAVSKGIAEKTEWVNFTEDVEREYRQAHLALNFSESESFSITCLEALFFGCPIIATKSGGPAEIIDHDVSGFLVEKGDIQAMVGHLQQLMMDSQLRERLSIAGKRIVRERFSIENTSFRLKRIYDHAFIH